MKPASTTLLKCSSKEFLQNTYWTKGYSLILNDQARSNVRVLPNGVLQIMNFTADNAGTYVCFSEGKKMKSCQLSILSKYFIFMYSKSNSKILTCSKLLFFHFFSNTQCSKTNFLDICHTKMIFSVFKTAISFQNSYFLT